MAAGAGDEQTHVLFPEVQSVQFEYFDGATWQTSWDGTAVGEDGETPIGPPAAVRITFTVAPTATSRSTVAPGQVRTYVHVVPILTANGVTPEPTDPSMDPSAMPSTTPATTSGN